MDQQERFAFSIVPILLLILLLRRARKIRFLLTYNYLDLGTKESAAVSLINRRRGKDTDIEERAGKPGFTLDHRDGLRKCIITGSFEPFGKLVKDEELALLKSMFAQTHARVSGKISFMFTRYESTNVM